MIVFDPTHRDLFTFSATFGERIVLVSFSFFPGRRVHNIWLWPLANTNKFPGVGVPSLLQVSPHVIFTGSNV